jgi:retron-type reverse transcriptase
MRRHGGLWDSVVSWENLTLAARKARRGKRDRPVVQRFEFRRETELLRLQRELKAGVWRPGPFTTHWITRPKPRLISAAPYRDRVVHHAVMNILEPILDRHFHPDSYACRKGKGTHAAARRLQELMRHFRYAVPCDVRKFFPSIDHQVLQERFRRRLKDRRLLVLLDGIVDGSNDQEPVTEWFPGDDLFAPSRRRRGLPIGNLTSQWFANWYLDPLDHLVTSTWGLGHVRYCDDFVLLGNDRQRLAEYAAAAGQWLAGLRLRTHADRPPPRPVGAGLTFVGYRVFPSYRLLPAPAVQRFIRRVRWMRRAYAAGRVSLADIRPRLMSWMSIYSGTVADRVPSNA